MLSWLSWMDKNEDCFYILFILDILIYTFTRHRVGLWHVVLGCLQLVGPTVPGTSTSVWYVGCALYHRNKYPILLLVCVWYKSKDHRYKYPILLLVCVWYKSKDTLKQVLNTTGPWVNCLLLLLNIFSIQIIRVLI